MSVEDNTLKIALDRYDRHFPFFDSSVRVPAPLRLEVLQVGQSQNLIHGSRRHERMYESLEFDVCEFGLSPYIMMAAGKAELPFVALPAFPRRLFSQSQMFVRADSAISKPSDLVGKRVALRSFHTTLSLLAKGDLKFHYDVPWEEIIWCPTKPEMLNFSLNRKVRIEPLASDVDLGLALENGTVDAVFLPHPPRSIATGKCHARRLFADSQAEEKRYFQEHGFFPIMHLLVVRRDLIEREPELGHALLKMYAEAHAISESYLEDPNWSQLAWARHTYEDQRSAFGDAWPVGFSANRQCLTRLIAYAADQGLISEPYPPERLFPESVLDT